MRALIIGAGATIQEEVTSGKHSDFKFPTMDNFAREMWRNFQPEPFLSYFLQNVGVPSSLNPKMNIEMFCDLERNHVTNVEKVFEFCWYNKNKIPNHPTAWHDMIYGCCFMPILDAMITTSLKMEKDGSHLKPVQALPANCSRAILL
jgi:hypothetical protein